MRRHRSECIHAINDDEAFAAEIGFTVERKLEKLRDVLGLIGRDGTGKAGLEWLRLYRKKGTRCVRRDQLLPNSVQSRNALGPVV